LIPSVTRAIEHAVRGVRHAWRTLVRMPCVTAVVVLSLAAGIGVNVAVFSWFQAVVLTPLPGVAGARTFHFIESRSETGAQPGVSWLEYRDLRARLHSVPDSLAFRMVPLNVGETARTERTYGLLVSDNYVTALGLSPGRGRFFRPEEVAGADPVVVISNGFWQTRFGAAADVVGRTLHVNGRDLVVIGVTPAGFQGTVLALDFSQWMPATLAPALFGGSRELDDRSIRGYAMMGRLDPKVSRTQAQAEVGAAMTDLARSYPASRSGYFVVECHPIR
jgi:putative ABC transport system permease protein